MAKLSMQESGGDSVRNSSVMLSVESSKGYFMPIDFNSCVPTLSYFPHSPRVGIKPVYLILGNRSWSNVFVPIVQTISVDVVGLNRGVDDSQYLTVHEDGAWFLSTLRGCHANRVPLFALSSSDEKRSPLELREVFVTMGTNESNFALC